MTPTLRPTDLIFAIFSMVPGSEQLISLPTVFCSKEVVELRVVKGREEGVHF